MPRGASKKREREYEELKDEFKQEGRYKGREEEVAARIVNKQRSQYGETKEARDRPSPSLPIDQYEKKTVDEIARRLDSLSDDQLREIRSYEKQHKKRSTLISQIDRQLEN